MTYHLDDPKKFQYVLDHNPTRLIILDCYADWCQPCKMLAPHLEKIAKENKGVIIIKCDVEESESHEEFSTEMNVKGLPTILFYQGGKLIDSLTGADLNKIKENIGKYAPKY